MSVPRPVLVYQFGFFFFFTKWIQSSFIFLFFSKKDLIISYCSSPQQFLPPKIIRCLNRKKLLGALSDLIFWNFFPSHTHLFPIFKQIYGGHPYLIASNIVWALQQHINSLIGPAFKSRLLKITITCLLPMAKI